MSTGDETKASPPPSLPPRRPTPPEHRFPEADPMDRFFGEQPDQGGRQATTARPQILAPQANEWDGSMQGIEVVRSRRPGLILLFLLALLAVALIALGLAAWSAFNGGDDLSAASTTTTTAPGDTLAGGALGDTSSTTSTTATTLVDPNALQVVLTEEPFICDGGTRQFAQLSGAAPSEQIAFTSPQSSGISPGTADGDGVLPIRWNCSPDQAGTVWELTATGQTSGKTVTFIFAGALAADEGGGATATTATTAGGATTAAPTALVVDLIEEPFRCDGETRVFGGLSGAAPNEQIAFTSPQSSGISPGTADAEGNLSIRWNCTPDQAGTVWDLTATGETSGRSVSFTLTGS